MLDQLVNVAQFPDDRGRQDEGVAVGLPEAAINLAHAVIHVSGIGLLMARTLAFTVAWIAFIVYAVALLRAA